MGSVPRRTRGVQTSRQPRTLQALRASVHYHLKYSLAKETAQATHHDVLTAVSRAVRDLMTDRLLETENRYAAAGAKRLYYLSIEFLIGRLLESNLLNLGLLEACRTVVGELGFDLAQILEAETDTALGNGGLGRLAACFLDSLATLDMPGYGYGINYEFGLFRQEIHDGYQREQPDHWLGRHSPWLIERPEDCCLVPLYGRVEHARDRLGGYNPMWLDWQVVVGVPHDIPVVGYGGRSVNHLRIFSARASDDFDMQIFNAGDYIHAVERKVTSENISKVLYPSDSGETGKELRLIQEYFLVACAVRDIVRCFLKGHASFDDFPRSVAIQLNDTHPALTVAELMRYLVDEQNLPWERAWSIVCATIGYTNHTLLSESLEKWPVPLLERVLPRHLQIIFEVNRRHLADVAARWPGDVDKLRRTSIIGEEGTKQVHMANLSIVGCHSTNGVSELHSELIRKDLVPHFFQLWPERFNNKTNGVTQRRWLLLANPSLAGLLTETIGDGWITRLEELRALEALAGDAAFREKFLAAKRANKVRLAKIIRETADTAVDPDSLFDIQAKRIHEYKRQVLNVLHIVHEYLRLVEDGVAPPFTRTYIFAGKAAPGYWQAKQVIKLINSVAQVVNNDPRVHDLLKVVFVPDYRVTLAERIIPAADLSEQISTAGKEASGTGNMKFSMNGAPTIGTPDGANIEIVREAGEENNYLFGLTAGRIAEMQGAGSYQPRAIYNGDADVKRVLDSLAGGVFSPQEPRLFAWLGRSLLDQGDPYFHLADLRAYLDTQDRAATDYAQRALWARKAILNVARIGRFSSDRTIREYADGIWNLRSFP